MIEANWYDDRIKFLKTWYVRKEQEMKNRFKLPMDSEKLTDGQIYTQREAKLESGR